MQRQIEELQRALEEAQRWGDEERRRREEERRWREEEQRRREVAEQRQEEAAQRQKEAEQRQKEAEQRQKEAEQRQTEAEQYTQSTRLSEFLEHCHHLCASIEVVFDQSLTTRGDVTNPDNRLYPKRILPWTDFNASQAAIWQRIGDDSHLSTRPWFPSRSDFRYVYERLRPISSESGLRQFEAQTVESMVRDLFQRFRDDTAATQRLEVDGEISFQDHTNLGDESNEELARHMQDLRLRQNAKRGATQQSPYRHRGTADQFCILHSDGDDVRRPLVAIEYKAPHKLTLHTVSVGLKEEIQTYQDIICHIEAAVDDESQQTWWCRYVMAATVTQLFSYMVTQGTRHGYICTGQAYVFLRIGDDPSDVNYSVHIPTADFDEADEWRMHHTAVAQIFAFIIQAAQEAAPTQEWHQKRDRLSPWKMDLRQVLHDMPESIRTNTSSSAYVPNRFVPTIRSPIRTRASCRPRADDLPSPDHGSDSDQDDPDAPESPSEKRRQRQAHSRRAASRGEAQQTQISEAKKTGMQGRSYCTHQCLLGLAEGGELDHSCPNFALHGSKHLDIEEFLAMVKRQLRVDIGTDANCIPLNIHGSRGGLLKISLSAWGYTFVAKGTEERHVQHLCHEEEVYRQLRSIQGKHVPVCLGIIKLQRAYHYSGARLSRLLLLSWGGRRLSALTNQNFRPHFPHMAEKALCAIHRLRVQHNDAEPRNMLFDPATQTFMFVDFERSIILQRADLPSLSVKIRRDESAKITPRSTSSSLKNEMRTVRNAMSAYL